MLSMKSTITELGAISPDVPSLCLCELNTIELSIDIHFPDLGTKGKNVKEMRKSKDVPLSYREMNESNDNFESSQ